MLVITDMKLAQKELEMGNVLGKELNSEGFKKESLV